ncbi:MAG TPA: hypothetical protein VFN24_09715 [Microbacterium sp.]|nr:hypothetical protein [Microbacterium sp.]
MIRRRVGLLAALACAALLLSGCDGSPRPAPSTSTPLFADEAEAFAAAEATYRAYVDALNAVDLSDPATFEPVFALTTGEANAEAKESFSRMHADRWQVKGESTIDDVLDIKATIAGVPMVALAACLNVSDVTVTDSQGNSVVEDNRPDVQSIRVELIGDVDSETGMLVSALDGYEGSECG